MSKNIWINLIGFQLAWWLCVLLGNTAVLWVLVLLVLHIQFHPQPVLEIRIILLSAGCGIIVDSLLTLVGVFQFTDADWILPLWLVVLWLAFCTTLRQGLSWFQRHYWLASGLGGGSAALTYLGAARLGAVQLGLPEWQVFILLVLIWSALFPLLLWISQFTERRYVCQAS
ncbi:DUF2878 domain-containing protein [Pontibacter sp. JAM-7]|uniref:DUF2878 domain-containing protein n=1 Tax=Pontibacter sp. JAM-7 TaxID=3366581 RepID=UPI003AF9F1B8